MSRDTSEYVELSSETYDLFAEMTAASGRSLAKRFADAQNETKTVVSAN